MIDIVLGEIEPPPSDVGWKAAIRQRVLAARQSLARHPWASAVIDRRADPTPEMLAYMDSMIGMFLAGGFSIDLTHHALHAMGNRLFGFTPAALNDSQGLDPESLEIVVRQPKGIYPHVAELTQAVYHDAASVVCGGCDDQFEFEFALDLPLTASSGSAERRPHNTMNPVRAYRAAVALLGIGQEHSQPRWPGAVMRRDSLATWERAGGYRSVGGRNPDPVASWKPRVP